MNLEMTINEVVTELSMTSSYDMHLIVEGCDDSKFYRACLNGIERVNIICVWGSDNVSRVIETVNSVSVVSAIKPTLGIIDRDYRIPLRKMPNCLNLLYTDMRDIECMMVNSRAFDNVLTELATPGKLKKMGGVANVRASVLASAELLGRARYYSQHNGLNTSFKNIELERIICKKTLRIDVADIVKHVNARQSVPANHLPKDTDIRSAALVKAAVCEDGSGYFTGPLLVCCGHDIMEILAVAFRSLLATMSSKDSCRESIEQRFRLNYVAYFRSSQLAASIDNWLNDTGLKSNISLV